MAVANASRACRHARGGIRYPTPWGDTGARDCANSGGTRARTTGVLIGTQRDDRPDGRCHLPARCGRVLAKSTATVGSTDACHNRDATCHRLRHGCRLGWPLALVCVPAGALLRWLWNRLDAGEAWSPMAHSAVRRLLW